MLLNLLYFNNELRKNEKLRMKEKKWAANAPTTNPTIISSSIVLIQSQITVNKY